MSDHGNVSAFLELDRECKKQDIAPVYAAELYHGVLTEFKGSQRDQAHLIVGALTDEGLKNLFRLTDFSASNFRFVPRVNWEALEKYKEGLFVTSACLSGLVAKGIQTGDLSSLDRYLDIFKDNFYIELHTYPSEDQKLINLALMQLARERGLPVIWASDAHYSRNTDFEAWDKYLLMQTGQNVATPAEDRKMSHPNALYIKSEFEVREDLAYLSNRIVDEAITNSYALAMRCNARLPEVRRHLPVFIPSESALVDPVMRDLPKALDLLRELSIMGLYERYGEPSEEAWERLEMELGVFIGAGLEHYILQVWEVVQWAKSKDIISGPGRGSAAGSIVCYALGITEIDPLYYNLYFERFYNAGREKGLPDVDIDFPRAAREDVKEFMAQRWGRDKVENIGTTMRLKPIAALFKTYKTFLVQESEYQAVRAIIKKTPMMDILGADSIGWNKEGDKTVCVMESVGAELDSYIAGLPRSRQSVINRWIAFVAQVVGRVSGYGIHASGVVVSDIPLNEELPRGWSASSKAFYTQFSMEDVSKRGFLKDDFLGLRNLDTLEDWEKQLKGQGINVRWSGLEMEEQPEEMWQMLEQSLGMGIFQIEDKSFPLGLCKKLKPRSVSDLAVIVALNRPGPIQANSHERYIARKSGEEPVTYDDPFLESILNTTYGEWIWQEQIIALFNKLGYSLQEADAVRSLLGKKNPEEQGRLYRGAGQWQGKGYLEMAKKAGLGNAQLIWDKISGFSFYAFNVPHAVSYALIGFRTLFAKYWAPSEFILACIRTNPDDKPKYIAEGRRLGIRVLPPHIRNSDVQVGIKNGDIYLGFSEIKGLSKSSSKYLLYLRDKYDGQAYRPDTLREVLEKENRIWMHAPAHNRMRVSPKTVFKSSQIDLLEQIGAFDEYAPSEQADRRLVERELLGMVLTDTYSEVLKKNEEKIAACDQWEDLDEYGQAQVPAIIAAIRETQTKRGEKMAILSVEYETRAIEVAVFPQQFKTYQYMLVEGQPAILTIKANDRGYQLLNGRRLS